MTDVETNGKDRPVHQPCSADTPPRRPRARAVAAEPVTIFAAASLKNALDAVNAAFAAETGQSATASYAASSALAKQIEAGAPADLFISADLAWMDAMESKGFLRAETRTTLLGNRLVLVGEAKAAPISIVPVSI